jgi:hypothetical protein
MGCPCGGQSAPKSLPHAPDRVLSKLRHDVRVPAESQADLREWPRISIATRAGTPCCSNNDAVVCRASAIEPAEPSPRRAVPAMPGGRSVSPQAACSPGRTRGCCPPTASRPPPARRSVLPDAFAGHHAGDRAVQSCADPPETSAGRTPTPCPAYAATPAAPQESQHPSRPCPTSAPAPRLDAAPVPEPQTSERRLRRPCAASSTWRAS